MLSDLTPIPTLAVSDLPRARKFYEETLGLQPEDESPGGLYYRCGAGKLFVYPSGFAGTNKATAVTFSTDRDSFTAEVDALRDKGVSFQTFEYEGITWEGEVAVMSDGMRAVWFADPDGNILNLGAM